MNNVPLAAKFQHLMMGLKFLFALSALLLLACSQAGSTPTSTPVPVPTPTPSPTPTPIPPPVASFVLQDAGGSAPLTVRFSDTSEGPASSWEWDFGDGASSTEQNPAHEYTEAIAFTVRLTVSGPGGSDTAILQDAIAVSPGLLEEVVVNQAGITLQVEDSARLNAEALDRYGNQISDVVLAWATQGPQGSVDETGQFHAGTVAGSYEALVKLTATQGERTREAFIDVIVAPGRLSMATVDPKTVTLDIGAMESFSFRAYDEFDNAITNVAAAWTVPTEVGTINAEGNFQSGTKAGTFPNAIELTVVNGTDRASAEVDVTILPDPLANVTIEPSYVLLQYIRTQQFSANGTDSFGNLVTDYAFVWEATGGSIDQSGSFSAGAQSGRYEVRATAVSEEFITGFATVDLPEIAWNFAENTFGWTARNDIGNWRTTEEGLDFDSAGQDPILDGPKILGVGSVDLIIKIRMRSTAGGFGEFWGESPGPQVTFDVVHDGQWHDYEFQIPQQPSETFFRFDPAMMPGHVTIASIQIIPNPSRLSLTDAPPTFLRTWDGDGQLSSAARVATDSSGNVYVASYASHQLQKFSSEGTFITEWGSEGSGIGQFFNPRGVAVDSAGNVYVADTGNNRMQKFDGEGQFILSWGSFGNDAGQFIGPYGVAIDLQDNVYITEYSNHRIQKFTSDGIFIIKWGGSGTGNGQFAHPAGIAVDASGNVYVADYGSFESLLGGNRVQKFTSDGVFVTEWGSYGSELGRFNGPGDVAVDSFGNVYVVEWFTNRIQKFTEDGTFLTAWGSEGSGDGQFSGAWGLAVDPLDRIIVADWGNFRVLVFEPTPTLGPR